MELLRFPAHGGFSVRSILTFVLTVFATALLWVTFTSAPTYAADNATWTDGDVILFDGHGFNLTDDAVNGTTTAIPSGSTVYRSAIQTAANGAGSKIFVIYFSSGVDPPTATAAKYVEFDYNNGKLSNPQNVKDITMTPQGDANATDSSCSVGGIGWIICPVSVFLAESMDNIFNVLASMIETQPLILSDPNNSMFVAWGIARNLANVAFVIAFLMIIFSQLTNVGVSNYGIKKLTPRLIVAAILVNISFYISAAAIDISNVLGYGIQDLFNIIREQTFNLTNDNFGGVNSNGWSQVTAVVLAGGGIIGGVYYLAAAGPYFLITLLVSLGLVLLLVLIILAARQAIILLLVIVSPLAFVANLLPNTEKLFRQWRELFTTMLVFFPAFSLVFGGSQLAGQLIIQNAGDNIITVLFGMAVQVAPLVITPIILKFSGGLLGRIAQIANNPSKGLLDRTKNWQADREKIHRSRNYERPLSWRRPGSAMVKGMETLGRKRKEAVELAELRSNNTYKSGATHQKMHDRMHDAKQDERLIHSALEEHTQKHTLSNTAALGKEMKARVIEDRTTDTKGRLDATYAEMKSGSNATSTRYGAQFQPLEHDAEETARNIALNSMRQQSATRMQNERLHAAVKDNDPSILVDGQTLRNYAGGVQGHVGAQRALAFAISEKHKAHAEVIGNANAILSDYNLDAADNLQIAMNKSVRGIDVTADIQEAAIKRVAGNGVIPHINQLLTSPDMDWSPQGNEDFRLALVEGLKANPSRPKYIGYGVMDKLTQGIKGENGAPDGVNDQVIDTWIEGMMSANKLSAKELAGQDEDTLVRIKQSLPRLATKTRSAEDQVTFNAVLGNLQREIQSAHSDEILWNAAGERKKHVREMSTILEGYTGIAAIPQTDTPNPGTPPIDPNDPNGGPSTPPSGPTPGPSGPTGGNGGGNPSGTSGGNGGPRGGGSGGNGGNGGGGSNGGGNGGNNGPSGPTNGGNGGGYRGGPRVPTTPNATFVQPVVVPLPDPSMTVSGAAPTMMAGGVPVAAPVIGVPVAAVGVPTSGAAPSTPAFGSVEPGSTAGVGGYGPAPTNIVTPNATINTSGPVTNFSTGTAPNAVLGTPVVPTGAPVAPTTAVPSVAVPATPVTPVPSETTIFGVPTPTPSSVSTPAVTPSGTPASTPGSTPRVPTPAEVFGSRPTPAQAQAQAPAQSRQTSQYPLATPAPAVAPTAPQAQGYMPISHEPAAPATVVQGATVIPGVPLTAPTPATPTGTRSTVDPLQGTGPTSAVSTSADQPETPLIIPQGGSFPESRDTSTTPTVLGGAQTPSGNGGNRRRRGGRRR